LSFVGFTRKPAFPAWSGPAERLRHFLRDAILAPSRHNAQPWLFDVDGDEVAVRVDARRSLRAADPLGREATIACGAAFENLRLSAAHHGHDLEIRRRDARVGEPVATARLGARRAPTADEEALFAAIGERRTATLLRPEPVPPSLLLPLKAEMGGDATLRLVPRWLARPVTELVWEANGVQWANPRFRAEVALWTRGRTPREADALAALAPGRAATTGGILQRLLRRARGARRVESERRLDLHTRTLLLLSTAEDGPRDWFAAGRAMQRLLLRATAQGLSVAFLSQPVEVPDVRRRLRREVGEHGYPQLLLRVGWGRSQRATRRRPVDLVLRSFSSEVSVALDLGEAERGVG
jgi:hypothetical protein